MLSLLYTPTRIIRLMAMARRKQGNWSWRSAQRTFLDYDRYSYREQHIFCFISREDISFRAALNSSAIDKMLLSTKIVHGR